MFHSLNVCLLQIDNVCAANCAATVVICARDNAAIGLILWQHTRARVVYDNCWCNVALFVQFDWSALFDVVRHEDMHVRSLLDILFFHFNIKSSYVLLSSFYNFKIRWLAARCLSIIYQTEYTAPGRLYAAFYVLFETLLFFTQIRLDVSRLCVSGWRRVGSSVCASRTSLAAAPVTRHRVGVGRQTDNNNDNNDNNNDNIV